jgi:hypothetical protein
MEQANKVEFGSILNGLAAIKPGAKLTPEALDVWWASFADWSIEDFRSAAARLAKTHEFMPNPYHFEQLRKASQITAPEAWTLVLEAARGHAPRPQDPRIEAAVRALGGYNAIAMSKTDSTHFLEKRFAEHYESISDAEDVRESVPNLAGPSRLGLQSITKLLGDLS